MRFHSKQVTVILTALIVTGMVAPVGMATASSHEGQLDSDVVFEVSNGGQIHAWERAGYPLRTDDTDAATQVSQPNIFGQEDDTLDSDDNGGDTERLDQVIGNEQNPAGIHDTGSVRITFDSDRASNADLYGQSDVQLVAARLTPQDGRELPSTTDDALDLLSDVDDANANASFEMLETGTSLDSGGELDETYDFSTAGQYVVFAAIRENGENGFTTSGDDISVDGEVTIIGTDMLTIQQGTTEVDEPSNADPGDNLTFQVDANSFAASNDGSMTHAIAIYNESRLTNARFDYVVDSDELGTDFSASEDSQLEHSIANANGIARVEDGTTINGNDLSDGEVARPVSASAAIDFFADEAGTEDPNTHTITNGGESSSSTEDIDASVTAINSEDRETTISVDTFENWSSETAYRYVVFSSTDDTEEVVSTNTGTIELDGGGGSGGGGSGGDGGGSDASSSVTSPVEQIVPSTDGTSTAFVNYVAAGQTITVNIEPPADGTSSQNTSVEQVNINSTAEASGVTVSITQSDRPSDGTPENDQSRTNFGYVEVATQNLPDPDRSSGSFTFTVSEERLNERGVAPENVQLYRYNQSWGPVETRYLGDNRYRAHTPGFSWFAIGVQPASLAVSNATLNATSVGVGDPVSVSAVVENTGGEEGNLSLDLTANGEVVETRTVTVGANNATTETFTISENATGEYDIAVNDVSAGTLSVTTDSGDEEEAGQQTEQTTEPAATDGTGSPPADGGGGFPVTIVVLLVVILALAVGGFYYYQGNMG